ncbi:MAG TPA: DciA family protein [Candidatus Omnitrophota bacterium]|nr:DciA family protein [Candidatus Omnitrophota bacterium]
MDEIREILPAILKGFTDPEKQKRSLLVEKWSGLAGEKLAKQTTPRLSSKGILYVYVKEAVLAYEISQKYKTALLKKVQAVLGEEAVKEVRVLVGK